MVEEIKTPANVPEEVEEETQTMAERFEEENGLDVEINQAYIDNVGEEYAKADDVAEAYAGQFDSDEEFAQNLAEEIGAIDRNATWPNNCIDWERAGNDIMYDYFSVNNYYFRNL